MYLNLQIKVQSVKISVNPWRKKKCPVMKAKLIELIWLSVICNRMHSKKIVHRFHRFYVLIDFIIEFF